MTGHFFVFEGPDGSGKSTQSKLFAEWLTAHWTREPGGTPLGTQLRELLLDPNGTVSGRTEALLMAADRSQHVDEVIKPMLASGQTVVCDRYIGSTLAYQGYGRGYDLSFLRTVSLWAAEDLMPDLTIFLTVPYDVTLERMKERTPDKFEALDSDFHARVNLGYSRQAKDWSIVDGVGTVEEVHERVKQVYSKFISQLTKGETLG